MFPHPQPLHRPVVEEVFAYNFIYIAHFHARIKNAVGIHRYGGTEIADIEATASLGTYAYAYGK